MYFVKFNINVQYIWLQTYNSSESLLKPCHCHVKLCKRLHLWPGELRYNYFTVTDSKYRVGGEYAEVHFEFTDKNTKL